jgi:transposase
LVKDLLSNNNETTLELPPHSPDLVPADLFLFSQMKSALKEECFCVATDIIKNATEN